MERPPAIPILSGILIAVAGFAAILTAVAWLLPGFLRFAGSPWAHLFGLAAILSGFFFPVVALRRNRRRSRV